LVVSMVIAGSALYACTLAGGLSGWSTGPNVAVEQSANGIVAAAVGAGVAVGVGLAVGTGAVGVGLGSAGSGELAPFTPIAIATTAITTTAPDPSSSGKRRRPPFGSLIDYSLLSASQPAAARAWYVMIMSAPARWMPPSASRTAARSSNAPAAAA
jgi:hypothetical protein